jgi:alkylation response protein AidB-like acyl-CoA dehydrogenase
MDFGFGTDQEMLRRSFATFLTRECSLAQVKEWVGSEKGFSEDLWEEMGKLGWLGLMHEEKFGGSGLAFMDLFILFEEMGAALLPSPFFTSAVLSGMLIRDAGSERLKGEDLPAVVRGEKILTLALLNERGEYDAESPGIEAVDMGEGRYRIRGSRLMVPYAHVADATLFCATVKGKRQRGPTLFRVGRGAGNVRLTRLDAMTGEKTFAVSFDNVLADAEDVIGEVGSGSVHIAGLMPRAIVLKCGEMVGGLRRVLDMTVAYVKERCQFGRPLGSLQIVQHHCADMASYLETSRLMAYHAASLVSDGKPCNKEVAMAKAWCGEAYRKGTWIAHQVHGGIGFTEEYNLHLFYRHAKGAELSFGDAAFHRSIVADGMGI